MMIIRLGGALGPGLHVPGVLSTAVVPLAAALIFALQLASAAPARADIAPEYDPYLHEEGAHEGPLDEVDDSPREDFVNTVFWHRARGADNMQAWLESVAGFRPVYSGWFAPEFHVHFDAYSRWDGSLHGLSFWNRYSWRSAQVSMGTDYWGLPSRDHVRTFEGSYVDDHFYGEWAVGAAHYDVAVWEAGTYYPWHIVLSYEDPEYRLWRRFADAGYSVSTRYLGNAGVRNVWIGDTLVRVRNSGIAHTIRLPYRRG